jgi:hypothetical protein
VRVANYFGCGNVLQLLGRSVTEITLGIISSRIFRTINRKFLGNNLVFARTSSLAKEKLSTVYKMRVPFSCHLPEPNNPHPFSKVYNILLLG